MKGKTLSVFWALVMVLLAACAPAVAPTGVPQTSAPAGATQFPQSPALATVAPLKAAWETAWESLKEAAKKEGLVTVYAHTPQLRGPLSGPMEAFGIRMEFVIFSTAGADLAARVLSEQRAGIYAVDVHIGGTTTQGTVLIPAGVFQPLGPALILPEVTDPQNWYGGKLPWFDPERQIFNLSIFPMPILAINKSLVKSGDIESYRALLDPKWKDKIVLGDPTTAGAPGKGIAVLGEYLMGWDFVQQLAEASPTVLRDRRLMIDWLARGKAAIVIGPHVGTVTEFASAGAPLAFLTPKEGTALTTGANSIGLMKRAPHSDAAKVFINWLLTKEGATFVARASGTQTARIDVPTGFLDPLTIRQTGVKYVDTTGQDFILDILPKAEKKISKEIFGYLIK